MRSRGVSMRTGPSSTRSGIHLSVDKPADGFSEQENYSLAPEAFHLPPIAFTDSERAALQTALTLLDGEFAYAEPLRLALQQITWGRPRPLGSDSRQTIGLGITASAGGGEVSARLAKIDTAIYRRKRIEFEYHTMERDETAAAARSTRTTCSSRAASSTSSATRTSARTCASSGSRGSAGKVAYATKAEHDFQRPDGLRPARLREPHPVAARRPGRRRRGRDPRGPRLVRRAPVRRLRDASTGSVFRTAYAIPRLLISWALELRAADPRAAGAGRGGARARRRADRGPPRRAAGRRGRPGSRPRRRPRRDQRPRPRRRRRDPAGALRAARDARVGADRRRPRRRAAAGGRRLRAAADLAAGAARGRLGAQRRQLRRRRVRDLRRGPADRRDRGRPRAVLGHVRPPRAAAADRGQGARRGDRPDRARPAPTCAPRARRSSTRSASTRSRRACTSSRPMVEDDITHTVELASTSTGCSSSSTGRRPRTATPSASSSPTRCINGARGLVRRRLGPRRAAGCATSAWTGSSARRR